MKKDDLIKIYKKEIDKNVSEIALYLTESGIHEEKVVEIYRKTLQLSSDNIADKWVRGEKYLRTEFVLEAFGRHYPKSLVEFSLKVDAMVNILDDLFDESLSREEKGIYILEYLRVFSLFCLSKSNPGFREEVGRYFNKLITLALAESFLLEKIKKTYNSEEVVGISEVLLKLRSYDIDIFAEIALSGSKGLKQSSGIKKTLRFFRAMNILKKDILDIKHDKKFKQETVITHLSERDKFNFLNYIEKLTDSITVKAEGVLKISDKSQKQLIFVRENILTMIRRDKNIIMDSLKSMRLR